MGLLPFDRRRRAKKIGKERPNYGEHTPAILILRRFEGGSSYSRNDRGARKRPEKKRGRVQVESWSLLVTKKCWSDRS